VAVLEAHEVDGVVVVGGVVANELVFESMLNEVAPDHALINSFQLGKHYLNLLMVVDREEQALLTNELSGLDEGDRHLSLGFDGLPHQFLDFLMDGGFEGGVDQDDLVVVLVEDEVLGEVLLNVLLIAIGYFGGVDLRQVELLLDLVLELGRDQVILVVGSITLEVDQFSDVVLGGLDGVVDGVAATAVGVVGETVSRFIQDHEGHYFAASPFFVLNLVESAEETRNCG
jgi:hypothetical protein